MDILAAVKDRVRRLTACLLSAALFICSLFMPDLVPPEPELPPGHPIHTRAARPDTYAATDALGRELPGNETTGDARENRYVGLFYWTWHVAHAKSVPVPVNVNRTVTDFPSAANDLNFPGWGFLGMPHHWNEPLFGFYDTDDRWVLRKHAEMLANAGVDVIVFDNTNGTMTWKDSYEVLFEVFAKARELGVNTPKIAFLLPFSAGENTNAQLRELYKDIYQSRRYQDLWFYWKRKPLIMAHPDDLDLKDKLDREIRLFFTFRPGNPDYKSKGSQGEWGWLSVYPQVVYNNCDGTPEQTTVGVAQNYSAEAGLTAMNGVNVFGRTYTSKGYDTRENAKLYGANFAEQFEYALKVDPEFIFITGFNEWVAGRFESWQGVTNAFPDEFNDTFSRDIEPSKGDLGDNYYYQMVSFIRRFKGTGKVETDTKNTTIDIFSGAGAWQNAGITYYAYEGNTFDRDDTGYGGIRYTDTTGRNDITVCRVASDDDNVYFMVECAQPISPYDGRNWMRLLLDTGNGKGNWNGYEFIVNRLSPSHEKACLEASTGGWNWQKIADVDYHLMGCTLQIKTPKNALGLSGGNFSIRFKWTDNTLENGDIMDFYLFGDTAPLGRFQYRYLSDK